VVGRRRGHVVRRAVLVATRGLGFLALGVDTRVAAVGALHATLAADVRLHAVPAHHLRKQVTQCLKHAIAPCCQTLACIKTLLVAT
jgi:hypothetical protein